MLKTVELRQERAALIGDARKLLDVAETEGRDLSAPETEEYDKRLADAEKLKSRYERMETQERLEAGLAEGGDRQIPAGQPDEGGEAGDELRTQAFSRFLTGGERSLTPEQARALQVDSDTLGGYVVAPEQFINALITGVDDEVFIRQFATKFRVNSADSMGAPALDTDMSDADWTTELATGSEDTSLAFGKRELKPHPFAKRVKVSNRLIRISAIPIENLVRNRLAYKFGITEEKGFLTGSGNLRPLGLFTASSQGISTSRDATCGSASAFTADGLKTMKYDLKSQYWGKARWIFHRDGVEIIDKLKDGNGQYILKPGLEAAGPDTLLGFPFHMSEYAPNTFTASQYVAILGDFTHYWIADALDVQVQRLVELYAETNETGYIGRAECDGMPVLEEAFVRGKLSA